jgi:predicted DNA-binding transcriptional regulator AlpA
MVTKFLRYKDLVAAGIVNNWPSLRNKIAMQGFPPGRLLGPNTRAWTVEEIESWLASRPVETSPERTEASRRRASNGIAKRRQASEAA